MITSTSNRRVRWVRGLQDKRRKREEERAFVIEGARLAREAIEAGIPARLVLYTDHLDERGRGLVNGLSRLGAEEQSVSDHVLKACSSTETPSGILAVLAMPALSLPQPLTLALILDGLADPGNLGTILRTALAAGVEGVFLTGSMVDAFSPKVVRAGMGAHFRIPLLRATPEDLRRQLAGMALWLAEPRAGVSYRKVNWRTPVALAIGGEADGPSVAVRELATGSVYIPMPGAAESLNAAMAAGVILFEIAHQRGLA
jgi:TrmH family RNA methyltransferase